MKVRAETRRGGGPQPESLCTKNGPTQLFSHSKSESRGGGGLGWVKASPGRLPTVRAAFPARPDWAAVPGCPVTRPTALFTAPQTPWWRSRAGDAAVPVCMCMCMCPCVSEGGGGGGRDVLEEGGGLKGGGIGRDPPSSQGPPKAGPAIFEASILLAPKAPKQNFGCQPPTFEGEEGGPGGGDPPSSCGVGPF